MEELKETLALWDKSNAKWKKLGSVPFKHFAKEQEQKCWLSAFVFINGLHKQFETFVNDCKAQGIDPQALLLVCCANELDQPTD